jgi:hypothetical protein
MTLAIAHAEERNTVVLDLVRERKPPFSPDDVVEEFAGLCRTYNVRAVFDDRYAGEWPQERFRSHGLQYKPVEQTKSDLYQVALPLLTGRAELLDAPRLIAQLCALERLTSRVGRDSISHPPGGHDDVANAAAGALVLVGKRGTPMFSEYVPAPGAGGGPTWSAADIARFTREVGGPALGL